MNYMPKLDRRSFVIGTAAVGTGFTLGMSLPFGPDVVRASDGSPEINAWVVIRPDDTVVIRIARSEMGQGTMTGLAQLVAEELDADWSKVKTEYPTPGQNVARKRVWRDFNTTGSRGIRDSHEFVRAGGATARAMLVQAAADQWKVSPAECTVANGVITHAASKRSVTFGKVAEAAAKLTPPKDVKVKDPKDWKIAGKPLKRLDTVEKTVGQAMYSMDTKLPNMVIATIKQCPVHGGKLKSFDAAEAKSMKGVKNVLQIGEAVVVVADTFWRAKSALDKVKFDWDVGDSGKVSSASIAEWLKEGLSAEKTFIGNQRGDAIAAVAGAAKKVEAVYSYPYQYHGAMEPLNATALYTPEKCEVWTSTQNGESALAATAEAAGLPVGQCEVYKMLLGGGFGRRARTDYVTQAVLIAKQMPGTPVKLIWTREEDVAQNTFHPTTQCKLSAGLDDKGNLTGLHVRISGQSILARVAPGRLQNGRDPATFQGMYPGGTEGAIGYDIPNLLVDHAMRNPHVNPGFWRGVNNNQNAIYLECFMDELAHAAGQDPLEFRRKMMANHPKHLGVLNAVAERVGWGKPAPAGVFRGLAQQMGYGSYVAACSEVSVSDAGELKIHRIVAATNCGHAVNPAQIERQVCGSFAFGLTAMLRGEITIKDGAVEQTNYDTYTPISIAELPKVETIIMPSNDFWGGVGEPTIFVAAPSVLNAIFAATGKRIRDLPLSKHSLKKA